MGTADCKLSYHYYLEVCILDKGENSLRWWNHRKVCSTLARLMCQLGNRTPPIMPQRTAGQAAQLAKVYKVIVKATTESPPHQTYLLAPPV